MLYDLYADDVVMSLAGCNICLFGGSYIFGTAEQIEKQARWRFFFLSHIHFLNSGNLSSYLFSWKMLKCE